MEPVLTARGHGRSGIGVGLKNHLSAGAHVSLLQLCLCDTGGAVKSCLFMAGSTSGMFIELEGSLNHWKSFQGKKPKHIF